MEHLAIPFATAPAATCILLLRYISVYNSLKSELFINICISAAIQNRVISVYTIEQSAGVEVLPQCVNDMGRGCPLLVAKMLHHFIIRTIAANFTSIPFDTFIIIALV